MKANIFKYIFFIIVVVLVIVSIYIIYNANSKEFAEAMSKEDNTIIRKDITLGITDYDTINPILSNNKDIQYIGKLIFDSLLEITQSFEIENNLAEEISQIDETTYLIKLKENIKWHDGNVFTTKDVAFTINNLKSDKNNSIYKEQLKDIDKVQIIDDYMIKIYLKNKRTFFEYMLNFPILASHSYKEETLESNTKLPIGTGEYTIVYIDEKNIKLQKARIDSQSKIEDININIYNSLAKLYTDFAKERLDLITSNNIYYEDYIGSIGYNVNRSEGRELDYIAINTKKEILSNVKVRQAINYAINKQNIIYNVYNNKYNIANFPLNSENYLYSEKTINIYDINKAKENLQESNLKKQHIELKMIVNVEKQERKLVAEQIKQQLKEIGIAINIIEINNEKLIEYINSGNYDLILTGNIIPGNPDLTTYFGKNNWSNYENTEILEILEKLENMKNKEEIKKEYEKIIRIYKQDIPFICLYFNSNIILNHSNIKGNMNHNWNDIFYNLKTWYKIEEKNKKKY